MTMAPPQRGFSLIETLVALALFTLGVLAMTEVSGVALRYMRSSDLRIEAAWLAADLAERIQANRAGLAAYALAPTELAQRAPGAVAACVRPLDCEPGELAAQDLADWQHSLLAHLPGGTGYVQTPAEGAGVVRLWVMWRDPLARASATGPLAEASDAPCPPGFGQSGTPTRCLAFQFIL